MTVPSQKCTTCPIHIRQGFPVQIKGKWALLCAQCAVRFGVVKP